MKVSKPLCQSDFYNQDTNTIEKDQLNKLSKKFIADSYSVFDSSTSRFVPDKQVYEKSNLGPGTYDYSF